MRVKTSPENPRVLPNAVQVIPSSVAWGKPPKEGKTPFAQFHRSGGRTLVCGGFSLGWTRVKGRHRVALITTRQLTASAQQTTHVHLQGPWLDSSSDISCGLRC